MKYKIMDKKNNIALINKTEYKIIGIILFLVIIIIIINPLFLTAYNITILFDITITLLALSLGETLVIMTGCIDLSIGSMLSLSSVLFALMLNSLGYAAYPLTLGLGMLQGFIVGVLFISLKIPSFITTFGMIGVYQSLAIIFSSEQTVRLNANAVSRLDFLSKIIFGPVKVAHLLVLLIFLIFLFIQKYTAFGKNITAVGHAEIAAKYSALNVNLIKMIPFIFSGFSAALGAIVLCSNLLQGDPNIGSTYLLNVMAVIVVGGTAMTGGRGGILNTLLGAFLMAILQNGMNIIGISVYYQRVIIGVTLLIAIALTTDKEKVGIVK